MVSTMSYEEQRIQNIKDNEALLLSLGLATPSAIKPKKVNPAIKKVITPKSTTPRSTPKREKPTPTPIRVDTPSSIDSPASSGLRRSARSTPRKDYSGDGVVLTPISTPLRREREEYSDEDDDDEGNAPQRKQQKLGVRTHDPKTFGHIPGVEVGTWWSSRMEASTAAIHAPVVAGISGNVVEGAYSVALSGGYPDDVDLGLAFTYTGAGGRDLKGTKTNPKNLRTAPQTFHQSFDHPMNAALKKSSETRKPVRVLRGFKLDSPYAPSEGYRYDGLYVVEKAWMAKGLTKGLLVCRYAFKRLPDQGDLPTVESE